MKYAWIRKHTDRYPVIRMCRALKVSRSGYYSWRTRKPSARQLRTARIAETAAQLHQRSRRIYGYRKVHEDILAEMPELACHPETVRRVMRSERSRYAPEVKQLFFRTPQRMRTPFSSMASVSGYFRAVQAGMVAVGVQRMAEMP